MTAPSYSFGLSGAAQTSAGAVANVNADGLRITRDLALSNAATAHSTPDWGVVSDGDAIRQALELRFNFFLAEWVPDTGVGIPFFEKILVKNPNREAVRKLFTDEALKEKGVVSVESFSFGVDARRKAEITMAVRSDAGQLIELAVPLQR